MGKTRNITGETFGQLTALYPLNKRVYNGVLVWRFLCSCGKESNHVSYRVVSGQIKSCGCGRKIKTPLDSGIRNMYRDYRSNANFRGYKFQLTLKAFTKLVKSPCHYCKSLGDKRDRKYKFVANGVDRKDNNLGYTLTNSVSCCSICNRAKKDLSYTEFKNWIKQLQEKN